MPSFHIWIAESVPAPSGFVHPEVRVTTEPIEAESFDAAVQAHVDSLDPGQWGLWTRAEDGTWTMCGCAVSPAPAPMHVPDDSEEETLPPGPLPVHELWVDASAVPEDTEEPVVTLTPEPVAAASFDDAVQIFKDHLCDKADTDKVTTAEDGTWLYNEVPIAATATEAGAANA